MKAFAALYTELDASNSTLRKVEALAAYLRAAPPEDAAWAVYFLAGGKPRQAVPSRLLRDAAREAAGIPEWLFDESYDAVGDLAETIAHVLPAPDTTDEAGLASWMTDRLQPLRGMHAAQAAAALRDAWRRLDWSGRFVLNKLITGGFRVGVSRLLVVRALAAAFRIDEKLLAQRMIGYTDPKSPPSPQRFLALVATGEAAEPDAAEQGHPYPFFLAHPLQQDPRALGDPHDWLVEWKWDGIRAQLVMRAGRIWLWSRGEELITERFPEIVEAATPLAAATVDAGGRVLDGEVLAWDAAAGRPMPFAALQKRIGRRSPGASVLREAPAAFVAYDLLEMDGADWRERPQLERRAGLEALLGDAAAPRLVLSPVVVAPDWTAFEALRGESRGRAVEGLMLKRRDARYRAGRTRADGGADWWKWKIEPFTVDAVLVYAQPGSGRRASLFTDYTFAVWDDAPEGADGGGIVADAGDARGPDARRPRVLVPFAKAYSGLSDEEIRRVDAIVRRTTLEKFGPVRSVRPTMVFELGFEGIAASTRHKSGIAVRFPRMLRWRTDKPAEEADTLATLRSMLAANAGPTE